VRVVRRYLANSLVEPMLVEDASTMGVALALNPEHIA
jgi:hypothetical protein